MVSKTTAAALLLAVAVAALAASCEARSGAVVPLNRAVRHERARFFDPESGDDDPVEGDVWPVAIYWIMVDIGSPPKQYPVAIDSGSATLDLPYYKCDSCVHTAPNRGYNPAASNSSRPYPCDGSCSCVSAGQCGFSNTYETCDLSNPSAPCTIEGLLFEDLVSIPGASAPARVQFGTITSQTSNFNQFQNIDGVIGLAGPGGVSNVFQTLVDQGSFKEDVFGMCFVHGKTSNGSMTVGGLDDRLYTGDIKYTANAGGWEGFYGFTLGNGGIAVNNQTIRGTGGNTAILDSGTNVLLLPEEMYESFSQILTAGCESGAGLPGVCGEHSLLDGVCMPLTEAQLAQFPEITIAMEGAGGAAPFELKMPPRTYLNLGEKKTGYCLGVRNTGQGGNFIIGDTSMEDYYVVFDRTAQTIGFADVNRNYCGSL